ncbi:MAG: ribonuclease P protein component, partial [Treponema sp.]|nr:ribonuclease P protein component [Treponema sp.]
SNVLWNAVIRNRARRLGREAFRLMKDRLKTSHDLIFLVYPEADVHDAKVLSGNTSLQSKTSLQSNTSLRSKVSLHSRSLQLESLFEKAGLLK